MKLLRIKDCDFGSYQPIARIASGGMADVYVAKNIYPDDRFPFVAIKRLHTHLAVDPKFVTMFLDEARISTLIKSLYVVRAMDKGSTKSGLPYLVMELVRGGTLQTLTVNSPGKRLPVKVCAEWISQAATGLHDAHNTLGTDGTCLELIHRDVSPQNILIGRDGRVRISDFGVARAEERLTRTDSDEVKGKWAYFAPERVTNTRLDRRADIFSLGVVAWEVLVGKRLFFRKDPIEVMERIVNEEVPLVSELRPDVPESVSATIAKALQKDRSERFSTALEFSTALREAAFPGAGHLPIEECAHYVDMHGGHELDRMEDCLADDEPTEPSIVSPWGAGNNAVSATQSQDLFHE